MKLSTFALLSTSLVLGSFAIGCSSNNDDGNSDGTLASTESQLVSDDQEASDADEGMEGVEEGLSGAAEADPGTPADATSDTDLADKVKTNPGKFFRPAGCITTTVAGNVATHVFAKCKGPFDVREYSGTIKSTYVREAGKLTVTHEATDFQIDKSKISGKRVVVYTKSGTTVSRTRTGDWSGTTGNGNAITHKANFTTTWDPATKCITRDGTAQTSVGGRSFDRSIAGYKRCGVGQLGCPSGGKIILSASRDNKSISVTIEFLGGVDYRVTRPSGVQVNRKLVCVAK